ncbi:Gfo/Idh/MocA family oxidoreductase [Cryobacterium sp. SO2]|uniref:Gfo/Idh/MocA family protein n=1 Tax=Cryobacterium sp. SO2 TaxID=1897060 RepID=UPI00223D81C8|nr:Gfo/Idh/MocA family oxidoreductase [Cryobacterium sp. SO2]WEO78799.1 Gfo/Idh/MocA family oxidoreductase [Cryobacterium sp. SO2]
MLPSSFPEPDLFSPGTGEPALRWGVLAPGRIAGAFVGAMHRNTTQRVTAVASRSLERAELFAREHGADTAYGSYEELVADPSIDVVYVASPQSEHLKLGLLAINAGKHVLIEKPMATTAADAQLLVDAAASAGTLLMEAMWSRYLPQASVITTLIADGVLGDLRAVHADFGQAKAGNPEHRLFRKELGGGALLDLGIYPVQLASMVLGAPRTITAVGAIGETGVDLYSTLVLGYDGPAQSTLSTSLLARTPSVAAIMGTEARIELGSPFHVPTTLVLADNEFLGPTLTWADPTGLALLEGLSWEATALATFVGEGRTESPLHNLDETVSVLATLDEALRQIAA